MKKAIFPTLFTMSLFTLAALAQGQQNLPESNALQIRTSSEIENVCRIKAKEIAAETYRGCVTNQKNAQIEKIKSEYQAKMAALKSHYEAELKKMAGANKAAAEKAESDSSMVPVDSTEIKTENLTPEAPSENKSDAVVQETLPVIDANQAEVTQTEEVKAEVVADPATGKMQSTKIEKTEKTTKSQKTLPAKKQAVKSDVKIPVTKKSVSRKTTVKIEKQAPVVTEMSMQLKAAPKGALIDANGELPEPIPVENIQGSSI